MTANVSDRTVYIGVTAVCREETLHLPAVLTPAFDDVMHVVLGCRITPDRPALPKFIVRRHPAWHIRECVKVSKRGIRLRDVH